MNEKDLLLTRAVKHIDITQFDARPMINAMRDMSFTARDLANATNIFNKMLQDKHCSIILTIAGSTSAAGCMKLYADLIKYNMIDVIVATGAAIVDMDFFEALGFKHYQGSPSMVDDEKLYQLNIDRIYDTYIDETELKICDETIAEIADQLAPRAYSSREFIRAMGAFLKKRQNTKEESLVELAYQHDVPIFCPAFTDSSAGFGLVMHQTRQKDYLTLDSVKDFRELTQIKIKAGTTGLLMIGGGVPKNFAQDTVVCAHLLGKDVDLHRYAIQITVADSRDGACSSSTLKEACSWGKVGLSDEQMVYAEATSVLPLLASDAYHRGYWKDRSRRHYATLLDKEDSK